MTTDDNRIHYNESCKQSSRVHEQSWCDTIPTMTIEELSAEIESEIQALLNNHAKTLSKGQQIQLAVLRHIQRLITSQ